MKVFKRSTGNKLQPQSVNPRRGTVAPRASIQPNRWWRSWWAKWLLLPAIIIVSLSSVGWYVVNYRLATIQTIELQLTVNTTPSLVDQQSIAQLLQQYNGQPLLLFNQPQLQTQLIDHYPALAQVFTHTKWPSTLQVQLVPQVAVAQIKTPSTTLLINRQGKIFAQAESPNLPTIVSPDDQLKVGHTVAAQDLQLSLALIQGLRNQQPSLRQITLQQNHLAVELEQPPLILASSSKPASQTIATIADLLNHFAQEQRYPTQLDLRYDRPVLRY